MTVTVPPTRKVMGDLVLLAVIEAGGFYQSPDDTAIQDLLLVSWPGATSDATQPSRKAVEDLEAHGRIAVECVGTNGSRYQHVRSIRVIGQVTTRQRRRLRLVRRDFLRVRATPAAPASKPVARKRDANDLTRVITALIEQREEREAAHAIQLAERDEVIAQLRLEVARLRRQLGLHTSGDDDFALFAGGSTP